MFKKLDNDLNKHGRNNFDLNPQKNSPSAWINPQSYERYDNSKEIICSGGANIGIVKHDGKIYRCFHDLEPIGDMTNYPNCMYKKAEKCKVGHICDSSGDQMSVTRWGHIGTKNEGYKNNPICTRWQESSDPNNLKMQYSYWNITPTYGCNMNCTYCCNYYPSDGERRKIDKHERPKEHWIKFFELLKNNNIKTELVYIGGESLVYPDIVELIKKSAEFDFHCSMVTNFSITRKLDEILNINFSSPEKFKFSISLHPINKNFDFKKIFSYIIKFKEKGHDIRTTIVSWPSNIPFYKEFKPILNSIGIDCWLKPLGGYNDHPEFTQELKKFIFEEGGYKPTPEHLENIKWIKKDWF